MKGFIELSCSERILPATRCPHVRSQKRKQKTAVHTGGGESVLTGSRYGSLALFNLRASILTRPRAGAAGNRAACYKINCVTGRNPLPSISAPAKRLLSHHECHVTSAAVKSQSFTKSDSLWRATSCTRCTSSPFLLLPRELIWSKRTKSKRSSETHNISLHIHCQISANCTKRSLATTDPPSDRKGCFCKRKNN